MTITCICRRVMHIYHWNIVVMSTVWLIFRRECILLKKDHVNVTFLKKYNLALQTWTCQIYQEFSVLANLSKMLIFMENDSIFDRFISKSSLSTLFLCSCSMFKIWPGHVHIHTWQSSICISIHWFGVWNQFLKSDQGRN